MTFFFGRLKQRQPCGLPIARPLKAYLNETGRCAKLFSSFPRGPSTVTFLVLMWTVTPSGTVRVSWLWMYRMTGDRWVLSRSRALVVGVRRLEFRFRGGRWDFPQLRQASPTAEVSPSRSRRGKLPPLPRLQPTQTLAANYSFRWPIEFCKVPFRLRVVIPFIKVGGQVSRREPV